MRRHAPPCAAMRRRHAPRTSALLCGVHAGTSVLGYGRQAAEIAKED